MARKVKGYVELYWTCPHCGNENAGAHAYCTSCGSPQPPDVDFHQGGSRQLLTDAEQIRRAKAGADIHCGFCGTRNPAGTSTCVQCGADLKEGATRSAGKVVGGFSRGAVQPIECPNCGAMNAGTRSICGNCGAPLAPSRAPKAAAPAKAAAKPLNRSVFIIGAAVLVGMCALIYYLFIRTASVQGTVTDARWQRSVAIEAFGPVQLEDWRDQVPSDGYNLSCTQEVRNTQDQPPAAGNYQEVCGTEYVVDSGNGSGEVVQDCQYQVYDDYCSYTEDAWAPVTTVAAEGSGLAARWPAPPIASDQRLGAQTESYACVFQAGGGSYTYTTQSFAEFQRCVLGSVWNLEVTGAGGVSSISPVN